MALRPAELRPAASHIFPPLQPYLARSQIRDRDALNRGKDLPVIIDDGMMRWLARPGKEGIRLWKRRRACERVCAVVRACVRATNKHGCPGGPAIFPTTPRVKGEGTEVHSTLYEYGTRQSRKYCQKGVCVSAHSELHIGKCNQLH